MALFFVHCSNNTKLPKLVVFISIDQGTPSIINKYSHLFSGGYKWLLEHGIKFENAYHEHGVTSTAPGHFAISTGRYPGIGGILGNQNSTASGGSKTVCQTETRYTEESKTVYSHSTITFVYEGKRYSVNFKK